MNDLTSQPSRYRGRFAPSPSGPLHFGSLVTAVGSYLEAKSRGGEWLVRIEDIDTPRIVVGAADMILRTLEAFGMYWDGEVVYQSRRLDAYQDAISALQRGDWLYPCMCSRKLIISTAILGLDGPIYPGTCRHRSVMKCGNRYALRVCTSDKVVEYQDRLQGCIRLNLEREMGDFVLRRVDGIFTYQLAVVVDDAWQGVTHVVRGADLLFSTLRQIYLQELLGYNTPNYLHLPLVVDAKGRKLSKQNQAEPVTLDRSKPLLVTALRFLGQEAPDSLLQGDMDSIWQWAVSSWRRERIPMKQTCSGTRDQQDDSMLRLLS